MPEGVQLLKSRKKDKAADDDTREQNILKTM